MTGAVRTIATEIAIAATAEQVWAVLVDFPAYPSWNPYLVRIDGAALAGTEISVTSRPGGSAPELVQPVRVLAVDPPRVMRWEGGLPDRRMFLGDHWFELDPASGRETLFRHYEHFSGLRASDILDQHGSTIADSFALFNTALKARVEALVAAAA